MEDCNIVHAQIGDYSPRKSARVFGAARRTSTAGSGTILGRRRSKTYTEMDEVFDDDQLMDNMEHGVRIYMGQKMRQKIRGGCGRT